MSDILNFIFSEGARTYHVAKCREIAAEVEHLALSASGDLRARYADFAMQLRGLADEIERYSQSAT
jgi:hypothetical protein